MARKFPYDTPGNGRQWENWVTEEDLKSLAEWERVFGEGFEAVLVFAYWLTSTGRDAPFQSLHPFRGEYYAFLALPLAAYRSSSVCRSPKWGTVTVPTKAFRELASAF